LDRHPSKREKALLAIVAAASNQPEIVVDVNGEELKIKAKKYDNEGRERLNG